MSTLPVRPDAPPTYRAQLAASVRQGIAQVIRPASHSRRAEAARAGARPMLIIFAVAVFAIITTMVLLDAREIGWMPVRGTASLWPLRILTDFGKTNYIVSALALVLLLLLFLAPRVRGPAHATLISFATRVQFLLLSVVVPAAVGDLLKGFFGRGRPFVGGSANAFNFSFFSWSEIYSSFPSGHATGSVALAVAVAALWPRLRTFMFVYALTILLTRLVLLAHHASDVIAGALLGGLGALAVRYWFAARRLAFVIRSDGSIVSRAGPPPAALAYALRRAIGFDRNLR